MTGTPVITRLKERKRLVEPFGIRQKALSEAEDVMQELDPDGDIRRECLRQGVGFFGELAQRRLDDRDEDD